MKKILRVSAVLLIGLTALTGCVGGEVPAESSDPAGVTPVEGDERAETTLQVTTVTTPSGDTVECVVLTGYRKGGLSCDWEGSR